MRFIHPSKFLLLSFVAVTWQVQLSLVGIVVEATGIACTTNSYCERTIRAGSDCGEDGFCTNPYHKGGCLANMIPNWHRTRVCGSEDPPEAAENGYCRHSPFEHMEVRISSQNWESGFFGTWILQILLGELLDVPVSIETGVRDLTVDFYNMSSAMEYGVGYDWTSIRQGYETGDCRDLTESNKVDYKTCSHVIPEMWVEGQDRAKDVIENGIGFSQELGTLAGQYWWVPRFTAERYPELLNYAGTCDIYD